MKVLPASMPSASFITMVIVGPSLRTRWMAMPIATSAASSGMIQMIEIRSRFFRVTTACGSASRSGSSAMGRLLRVGGVPDESRVEGFRGEHRQHHDGREEQDTGAGLDRRQRLELDQGDSERRDEHVEHRPAADEL